MFVPVLGPCMFESDLPRRPFRAQHMAYQIQRHAHGQLGVLTAFVDRAMPHLVIEAVAFALIHQLDQRAVLMKGECFGEVDQRVFQRCRAQAYVAKQPQGLWLKLLPVVQAEIVAAGLPRGFFQYFAVVGQGQAEGRMQQLLGVDAGAAKDPIQVTAVLHDKAIQTIGGSRQHTAIAGGRGVGGSAWHERLKHWVNGLQDLYEFNSSKCHTLSRLEPGLASSAKPETVGVSLP